MNEARYTIPWPSGAEPMKGGETAGKSKREAADIVAPFMEAGATWWNEAPLPWKTTLDDIRARIDAGPPKI